MKLGIALSTLGPNQLAYYFIQRANLLLSQAKDLDIIGFYERPSAPALPTFFATMLVGEAYNYDGILVATDVSTAGKVANAISARKKFFYVWDLEWLRTNPKSYTFFRDVYCDPRYELLARSASHARALEEAWNRPVRVLENLDLQALLELSCE